MVEETNKNATGDLIDGRLRILEKLGEGAMGQVFLCTDTKFDRKVAVKILSEGASNTSIKRFHVEAKALAQANHKNILTILDFGADGNRLYLVVEYIDGASLFNVIQKDGAMPLAVAMPILLQICEGLGYAHNRKILHRDIKPSNVMLVKNKAGTFDVKLVDFGLAKQVQSDQFLTKTGVAMGTPPYMSPETVAGQELDERSDIYSLGCLMFELLTGTPPFLAPTQMQIMAMHVHDPAPTLFEYSDIVFPPRLEETVSKCLRKSPSDRYQTVQQLANDLKLIDTTAVVPATSNDTSAPDQKKQTTIGWKTPLLAVIAFAFLGAGLYFYFDRITQPLEMVESTDSSIKLTTDTTFDPSEKDELGDGMDKLATEGLKPQAVEAYDQKIRQPYLLISNGVQNEQLKAALQKYRHMRIVSFYRSPVRDNGLQCFANLPVEELRIDQTPMKAEDYSYISKMAKLKTLRLTNSNQIPVSVIDSWSKLRDLKTLEIKNIGSSEGHLAAISRLPKLETLMLRNYDIDKSSIRSLQHSTTLRVLAFEDCNLSSDTFPEIQKLEKLEGLTFFNVPLKPNNLKDLGALRVKRLQISTDKIADFALLPLSKLTGLRELDLRGTPLSATTEQKLKTSLPDVQIDVGELPEAGQ